MVDHTGCDACGKVYSCKYALQRHWQRQPLCERWIELQPGLKGYVDDKFALPMTDVEEKELDTKCFVCGKMFTNVGNLNRHLDASVTCSKWALYRTLKPLETHMMMGKGIGKGIIGEEVPPQEVDDTGLLHHIIWNVYLSDKDAASHMDFRTTLRRNKVVRAFAILPDEKEEAGGGCGTISLPVPHEVLRYRGHEPSLDTAMFDKAIEAIEEHRRLRENVVVLCNSGYQRSLPFLCYYLVRHHPEEVPDVGRAIDIILPQVYKTGYASLRDRYVAEIKGLIGDCF